MLEKLEKLVPMGWYDMKKKIKAAYEMPSGKLRVHFGDVMKLGMVAY